jgi:hypothetical protein
VAVGCFADPHFAAPRIAVWCESKHPWLTFPMGMRQLEQQKA